MKSAHYAPTASNDIVWAMIGSPWGLLFLWLVLINLAAFLVFGFDKGRAKWKERHESADRVPEKVLLLLCALGGSLGGLLGMQVFHHKTRHAAFRIGVPVILVLQCMLIAGIWVYVTFAR